MPERVILEIFKDRMDWTDKKATWFAPKKVAEMDITRMLADELKTILKIQEDLGRTWRYTRIDNASKPRFMNPLDLILAVFVMALGLMLLLI